MELVLFVGIQGSGKSWFYRERFYHTHLRVNLDMLKTRHREQRFLKTCFETQQRVVVDNTNVTRAERVVYIGAAQRAGFKVIGYFFQTTTREAIARNNQRTGTAKIPVPGILGTYKRLQVPEVSEGFDELFTVTLSKDNQFSVHPCPATAANLKLT